MDQNNFSVTFSKKKTKNETKKTKGGKTTKRVIERDIDEFKEKYADSVNVN